MSILLKLETNRLTLHPPQPEDLDNLYALQSDPEVMKYSGKGVRSKPEVLNGLKKALEHQTKHGFSLGRVVEKATGTYVGRAGLIHFDYDDNHPEIEVAYALTKAAWCKGYASELTKALIDWAFQHIPITKLVAVINPLNEASRRVLEKSKMHYKGLAYYTHWQAELAKYEIYKPTIDHSKIKLIPATLEDYPIIQNMGRFYVYDMSEYLGHEPGWEIPEDGLYECHNFKKYWDDKTSFPFLIRYENELAGFVIIDKKGSSHDIDFNVAQFFILRKFKDQGIGRLVATQCFNKFKGTWEVMVIPGNEGAYRFWRAIIKHYTANKFSEYTRDIAHFNNHPKNIFKFASRSKA